MKASASHTLAREARASRSVATMRTSRVAKWNVLQANVKPVGLVRCHTLGCYGPRMVRDSQVWTVQRRWRNVLTWPRTSVSDVALCVRSGEAPASSVMGTNHGNTLVMLRV